MNQIKKYSILLIVMSFVACASKNVPMKYASINSVQKFRLGLVELTSHEFNPAFFYDCMKSFPGSSVALDGQTRQELESEGWYSDNMIASLQKQDFETYSNIKNFSLLMMMFRNKEQKNFVRLVNFLNKRVITLSMTPESFSCENVLAAARVLVVDSIPPFADVYINDRKIGEAPIWTALDDGTYEVQCKLPDDIFPKKTLQIPGTVKHLCKRENLSMRSIEAEHDQNAERGEKSNSYFLYGVFGVLSLGGAVLPFLIF
jgi:PEGA domain